MLVGVAMIGFRMQIQLMHELAQARATVAKLAANEERLRLARDMHDLTGQSLSMITLKSELAAKRLGKLPSSAELDTVLGDLGDIGRVSRQTLHDIREAVSGYRRPTLAIEVITARNALEAADIRLDDDPELTLRSGTFDAEAEAVLAWCLREAVTNVIRHSRARNCRIRLVQHPGELSLEVSDDGHGPSGQEPDAPQGAGLHGMSERLSAEGGRLSLGTAEPGPVVEGATASSSPPRFRWTTMTHEAPVRLLLAEDQVMIREALAALLAFEGDMEVVAQVGRGDEVVKAAQDTEPDVAVLDIEMPGLDGLAAAAELKKIFPASRS